MHILIPRNSLLKELFPKIKNPENLSDEDIAAIKNAYSITNVTPKVEVEDDIIKIIFDEELIQKESEKFNKVVQLCEQNNYSKALKLVNELIEQDPAVSDYHRIKGQIFFEQGDAENAIDALIDAVRLDPENVNALILLGNLHARAHSDAETALSFYERVLELDPENYLAINNFGGNLANLGKYDEAKRYFELAHDLNPDYPNTLYGMALIESRQNNPKEAFDYVRRALIKLDPKKQSALYNQAFQLIREEAQKSLRGDLEQLVSPYKQVLEDKCDKSIVIKESSAISTPAKLEVAEVHNRENHVVKYQPSREGVEHLVMHELGHLDRQLEARKIGKNQLFTADRQCKGQFRQDNQYIANKLEKQNIPKAKIQGFINQIFDGLNSQVYNTPIDLFIEQKIFDEFPDLRPYQFISLLNLEQEYIQSATNKDVHEFVPKKIIRINKILSLVNTIQFKELYGVDLIDEFNPSKKEINEANELYKEWLAYFNDGEYAVEYELINLWADDFGVSEYFKLVDEDERIGNSLDSTVDQIEEDPLSLENDESVGQESFSNKGAPAGEMSTVMYIVDALQFFEGKSTDEIRKVGFEIGMLGRNGIDTDTPEKKYSLKSIPGKKFSGRHLLAYMYTAFQKFDPDVDTGIDFDEEYEQAMELFEKGT